MKSFKETLARSTMKDLHVGHKHVGSAGHRRVLTPGICYRTIASAIASAEHRFRSRTSRYCERVVSLILHVFKLED